MKFNVTLVLATLSLSALSHRVYANTPKAGIVDMQKVILSVDEGKNAQSELSKIIKEKEKELTKEKDKVIKHEQEFKEKFTLMSEKARLAEQEKLQNEVMKLRESEMKIRDDLKQKEAQATQKIVLQTSEMINKMGKDRDFFAIWEANNSGLLYVKDPVDLTNELISEYNKKHPVTGKKETSSTSSKEAESLSKK